MPGVSRDTADMRIRENHTSPKSGATGPAVPTDTKRLLVNADDLGLSPGINRGIERAHREGIVRSASLLVNAPGFDDAVRVIRENPDLSVGIHLTLVGGDGPVMPPGTVPSLVDENGRFPASYPRFLARYPLVSTDEIRRELEAQIERARAAGVSPTHLDSHQHLHLLPRVASVVLGLAQAYRIGYIRRPEKGGGIVRPAVRALSFSLARKTAARGLSTSDHFAGFDCSGRLTMGRLLAIIGRIGPGTTELMVHPGTDAGEVRSRYGWKMSWEQELAALISPETREMIERRGIEIVGHGGRGPGPRGRGPAERA
jgi:predicted glycoside hydrolase/deacetylase ChbG (UPF0249 family)